MKIPEGLAAPFSKYAKWHPPKSDAASHEKADEEELSALSTPSNTWSLTVEPFGYGPLLGYGGAAGYFGTPHDLFEVSYQRGSLRFEDISAVTTMIEGRWRHWFGPSFNLSGGVAQLHLQATGNLATLLGGSEAPVTIASSSRGLVAAIGNRWTWETFTIGCDWLGVYLPLQVNDFNLETSSEADAEDADLVDKEMRRLVESPVLTYLRIGLGIVF